MQMAKTRSWIERELLSDGGLRKQFEHRLDLHVGMVSGDAYANRFISREIECCETRWGPVRQVVSDLLRWKRGLWFYAGWIDQAALHVGKVLTGDERLFESMLRQIDTDQVDQGGDMILGFAPDEDDWLFVVDVSPQDDRFIVRVRTDSKDGIETVRATFPS